MKNIIILIKRGNMKKILLLIGLILVICGATLSYGIFNNYLIYLMELIKKRHLFSANEKLFSLGLGMLITGIIVLFIEFINMNGLKNTKKNIIVSLESILIIFSICYLFLILLKNIYNPPFNPDSWSYFELSKNIFNDFYKINTYRQFQFNQPYGVSFPPLFPVLIASFNSLLNIGIYAGYFINFLVCILTLYLFIRLSEKLFENKFFGLFAFTMLLYNQNYIDEVLAGRSIPLSILLTFSVIYLVVKNEKVDFNTTLLIGFLSGLLILNRFDFLLQGMVLGVSLIFVFKNRYKNLFLYYAILFITISPWVYYSYMHFSKPFISDNSRTVLLAFPNYVTDYFPDNSKLETVFTKPFQWARYKLAAIQIPIISFKSTLLEDSYIVFILLIIFWNIVSYIEEKKNSLKDTIYTFLHDKNFQKYLLFLPSFLVLLTSIFLTGYGDRRYFISSISFIFFLLLIILHISNKLLFGNNNSFKTKYAVFFLLFIFHKLSFDVFPINNISLNNNNLNPVEFNQITKILMQQKEKVIIFIDPSADPEVSRTKFGALTGITTVAKPANLNENSIIILIKDYSINYIYTTNLDYIKILSNTYQLNKDNKLPLYEIKK